MPARNRLRLSRLGFVSLRTGWSLTFRGWCFALGLAVTLAWGVVCGLYPFLAVTERVPSRLLVIEGWVPDEVVIAGWREFQAEGLSMLLVPGVPIKKGEPLSSYGTYAQLTGATLLALGCPTNQLAVIPAAKTQTGRTFAEAAALRNWLEIRGELPPALNVVTAGAHARRTRLLFERVFSSSTRIGIVAVPEDGFDPTRWWVSSDGFRTVIGEAIAYLHARFLFSPPKEIEGPAGQGQGRG